MLIMVCLKGWCASISLLGYDVPPCDNFRGSGSSKGSYSSSDMAKDRRCFLSPPLPASRGLCLSHPSDRRIGYYTYINRNGWAGLGYAKGGVYTNPCGPVTTVPGGISVGTGYHLRVTAIGSLMRVYVTNMTTPLITCTDATYSSGQIGVRLVATESSWSNISVLLPAS